MQYKWNSGYSISDQILELKLNHTDWEKDS